ncbi:MAG: hypothetical protein AAF996_18325 [Pseudomonadota bacterium]
MNSLPPLSLPRFHVNALTPAKKDKTTAAHTPLAEQSFDVPDQEPEQDQAAEAEAPAALEVPTASLLPEIDTGMILNSLETAVTDLERSALAHSQKLVAEFLQAAFPTLCASFLADEVVQAAREMAPNEIERLVVKVPPAFEQSFQRAVQASPKMAEICELETFGGDEQIVIDVSWRTGGLNFNMDQFLESSLGRLSGPTHMQEGQDV